MGREVYFLESQALDRTCQHQLGYRLVGDTGVKLAWARVTVERRLKAADTAYGQWGLQEGCLIVTDECSMCQQCTNVLASPVQFKSKTFSRSLEQVKIERFRKEQLYLCSPGVLLRSCFASPVFVPCAIMSSALCWQNPLISVGIEIRM